MGAVLLFLITLTCFIFAVAGVQLFGPMCTPKDMNALPPARAVRCLLAGDAALLTDIFNFKNIASGMLAFFRVSLIDGWAGLLATLSTSPLKRPPNALDQAVVLLRQYLSSLNASAASVARAASLRAKLINQAQALLPGCQSEAELNALAAAGVVVDSRPLQNKNFLITPRVILYGLFCLNGPNQQTCTQSHAHTHALSCMHAHTLRTARETEFQMQCAIPTVAASQQLRCCCQSISSSLFSSSRFTTVTSSLAIYTCDSWSIYAELMHEDL